MRYLQEERSDRLNEALTSGGLTILRTENTLPVGLIIVEEPDPQVCIAVYGYSGQIRSTIVNSSSSAMKWSEDVYQHYRKTARKIDE